MLCITLFRDFASKIDKAFRYFKSKSIMSLSMFLFFHTRFKVCISFKSDLSQSPF